MASTSTTVTMQGGSHTTVVNATHPPSPTPATGSVTRTRALTETLTLRLVPKRQKKSVKWTEDTIDNEFAGKRSSKKCCIFHKRRAFGEWSDDEDSEAECDCPQDGNSGNTNPE